LRVRTPLFEGEQRVMGSSVHTSPPKDACPFRNCGMRQTCTPLG